MTRDGKGCVVAQRGWERRFEELATELMYVEGDVFEGLAGPLGIPEVRGILPRGGTILGTSRTNPLKVDGGIYRIRSNLHELGIDALIAIGCVLRGETSHYDYVCSETSRGLQLAQMDTGIPVIFCVLTCDTLEQAIDRAGLKGGNKGFEAGLAAIEMAQLCRKLKSAAPPKSATRKARRK